MTWLGEVLWHVKNLPTIVRGMNKIKKYNLERKQHSEKDFKK